MAILRDSGKVTIECDQCGATADEGEDFNEALNNAKEEGFKIFKVNDDWHHACDEDCFEELKKEMDL